jgi:isopentenyl-diphosphate delta-isomerase
MPPEVILVNEKDESIGTMEKLEAHKKGLLHRAFSIFVFNSANELLIHQRAFGKYHSEGLWTNTCCSHPSPGETVVEAAHRRLQEEMGFDCEMQQAFHFIYKAELDNDLIENELDHVVIGYSNHNPILNTEEAINFKWIALTDLLDDINTNPQVYTFWFKTILQNHFEQLIHHIPYESLQKNNI